jgi:5,10-methylene-tetrahydrofolate dehydrogenase/methenyl tetrahydrofolate cyclohydrolase
VRNDQSQIIIDAGYGQHKGQPAGDVQFNEVAPQVCAITPIPGGV